MPDFSTNLRCCGGFSDGVDREHFADCARGADERVLRELGDRLMHVGSLLREQPYDPRLPMWLAQLPVDTARLERVLAERDAGDRAHDMLDRADCGF